MSAFIQFQGVGKAGLLASTVLLTINAGTGGVSEVSQTFPFIGCLPNMHAWANLSGMPPAGKDADEVGMDSFQLTLVPGTDQATVTLRGLEGHIHGQFNILCSIGV